MGVCGCWLCGCGCVCGGVMVCVCGCVRILSVDVRMHEDMIDLYT